GFIAAAGAGGRGREPRQRERDELLAAGEDRCAIEVGGRLGFVVLVHGDRSEDHQARLRRRALLEARPGLGVGLRRDLQADLGRGLIERLAGLGLAGLVAAGLAGLERRAGILDERPGRLGLVFRLG